MSNYIDSEHLLMLVKQAEQSGYAKAEREYKEKLQIAIDGLASIEAGALSSDVAFIAREILEEIK